MKFSDRFSAFILPLIFLFSFIACFPIFHAGFYRGHDWIFEFVRIMEWRHSLENGTFPVRWSANLDAGYGSPIFNFFPPIFLWLSNFFMFLKVPLVFSAKLSLFLLTLTGGLGMFFFAQHWFSRKGALIASLFFILAPYHFTDVFIRNAFSEFTALCVIPWVFFAITGLFKRKNHSISEVYFLIFSMTFFILSHNLSVILYLPLLLIYTFFLFKIFPNPKTLSLLLFSAVTVFFLTAFYSLPILAEQNFTQISLMKTGKFNVFENFLSFSSIFGFHHWASLTPFSIIFLIVTVLTLFLKRTEIDAPLKKILWASIGLIFLFTFLLTPQSHWIWKYLSFYRILGFPWRLLSPITFLLCFSAGIIPYLVSQSNHQKIILFSLIFLALFSFLTKYQYSNPQYVDVNQVDLSAQAIRNHRHRTTVYSEYRPIWAKNREKPRNVFFHSYNKEVLINHRVQKTHRHQVQIVNPNDKTTILININFFPGWKVYKNEIPLTTRINSLGLIEFDLPKGNHVIDVFFENSIIRYWGNMLFLFGIGCLVLGTLIWILRTEKKPAF